MKKNLKLFLSMLYISSFTFGGGFVIISMMKKKFVDELKWISEDEILDITAIAQSTPGAIAVNAAIMVGWKTGGFLGMVSAVLGTIIPPMVILTAISLCYTAFATNKYVAYTLNGMQAGVAAVILNVVFDLGGKVAKTRSAFYIAMMIIAFAVTIIFNINVIYIILAAVVVGVTLSLIKYKKSGSEADTKSDDIGSQGSGSGLQGGEKK